MLRGELEFTVKAKSGDRKNILTSAVRVKDRWWCSVYGYFNMVPDVFVEGPVFRRHVFFHAEMELCVHASSGKREKGLTYIAKTTPAYSCLL